jgi:Na+/H+-dicarboxylate symporter
LIPFSNNLFSHGTILLSHYSRGAGEWTNGSNILGLVCFAIVFGVALAKMGEKGKPLLDFFSCLREVSLHPSGASIRRSFAETSLLYYLILR